MNWNTVSRMISITCGGGSRSFGRSTQRQPRRAVLSCLMSISDQSLPSVPSLYVATARPGRQRPAVRIGYSQEGRRPMKYAIVIEKAESNYSAYVPDLPGCITTGDTIEEVYRMMQ